MSTPDPTPSKYPVQVPPAIQEGLYPQLQLVGNLPWFTLLWWQEMLSPQFLWHPPVVAYLIATRRPMSTNHQFGY